MNGFLRSNASKHVAIIATVAGREALLRRALESIARQTHAPDRIILVPDGSDAFATSIGTLARSVVRDIEIVSNRRTRGLSGAINTAIDHLLRTEPSASGILVSFLDDDDHWNHDYLATINNAARDFDGFLAGSIVRYDNETPAGRLRTPPVTLTIDDFLIGNPGLQNSNLSASLETLLLAGGFDEALSSCNDRDLVIRLLDLGKPYKAVPSAKMHHDTLHGHRRLSERGSDSKKHGLDTFFAKYQWRMSSSVREAFQKRAGQLFDWNVTMDAPTPIAAAPCVVETTTEADPLQLVVGIIVDGNLPDRVKPLLEGLGRLEKHPAFRRIDVVLLENGDDAGYGVALNRARAHCRNVWSSTLSDQNAIAEQIGLAAGDVSRNKAIAIARTLLQRFVHEIARQTDNAIAWILDDDVRIPKDPSALVHAILRSRGAGHDVVIGTVSGAPPVPAATTSRTQLLDIASFLLGAALHDPADSLPDAENINARWKANRRDYYYDLSRKETDRLETPFFPALSASTVRDGIEKLALRAPRIFAGEAITRPVESATGDIVRDAQPSRLRGGNTLVFRIDLLRDIPNLSPRFEGKPVRRSDMLWATNAALRLGHRVMAAPFSLEQDRSADKPSSDSSRSVIDDILGYAFFRAYEKVLVDRKKVSREPLDAQERAELDRRTRKYATERFYAFRMGFWRARGLAMVLRRCVFGDATFAPWWLNDKRMTPTVNRWKEFVQALDERVSPTRLKQLDDFFDAALGKMECNKFLDEQDAWLTSPVNPHAAETLHRWYKDKRIHKSKALVLERLGRETTEVLGLGAEGVVLRTGTTVVKLFDMWNDTERFQFVDTLRRLAETPRIAGLPEIILLHEWPDLVAVETRYEPSTTYEGGHGPELVECLRSLVLAGFVFTNVHPKNLRVTSTGVQIIDLGRSLQTLRPNLEEAMVRRAFLSWRFAFRKDLDELLRRSNTAEDFAELVGWRGLLAALRQDNPKQRLDALIEERIGNIAPIRLFDYGGGKPRALHWNAATNSEIAVFDLDNALRHRWQKELPAVPFYDGTSLEAAMDKPFDVVVCSLVLCIVDDEDARRVVANLRRLVRDGGRVFVAVCDPTSMHVFRTVCQTRMTTKQDVYGSTKTYQKQVGLSTRDEVHRPMDAYRRLFARACLRVDAEEVIHGIDIERFEEVGEFVLFELSPLAVLPVRTSLLIKACAMEADTIEHQVSHLVRMLGTPRGFDEVLVVIDPFAGPFTRQYRVGNVEVLRRRLNGLLEAGVIDRIVEGPMDENECREITLRWFGCNATRAHAINGQAVLAMLKGFDACAGDLVLHADADVLVGRPEPQFDPIAAAVRLFESIPMAVTLALPVLGDQDANPRFGDERGPYRVETQVGWLHKKRLLAMQPLPNEVTDGQLERPWHRSLDRMVLSGQTCSVRQGASGIWFMSPENTRKVVLDELLLLLDRVEAGYAPSVQRQHAATMGRFADWLGPKRAEQLVIVACGRNTGPGRITRFRDALLRQTCSDWGAILIDDASNDGSDECLLRAFAQEPDRVTLVRRRRRVGALPNIALAVRALIQRTDAIVVLVDLDDALGTTNAIAEVMRAYEDGADVTIGTMVRTDKHTEYPVDFVDPRKKRGGNVWQHLRTFRRYLFDRIDPVDFQLDGDWIDLASDWAFMLPIVEMATKPVWLQRPLYLHDPGNARNAEHRTVRENVIARLIARPPYSQALRDDHIDRLTVVVYHGLGVNGEGDRCSAIDSRRGIVESRIFEQQLRAFVRDGHLVDLDEGLAATRGERTLLPHSVLVTFDAGYRDFAAVALPILERLGVPFTRLPGNVPPWFGVRQFVAENDPLWPQTIFASPVEVLQ